MRPKPVLILWKDACHVAPGAWVDAELEQGTAEVGTVAWLLRKDKKCYTIAQSISEHGDVTGMFVIPKAGVKKLTKLKFD